MLFEIEYSVREDAIKALTLAAQKLPIKVRVVEKQVSKMKLQEIKEKSIAELKDLILNSNKELFSLRMKHNKMNRLENPAQIKQTKRLIARLKTVLRQKELNVQVIK